MLVEKEPNIIRDAILKAVIRKTDITKGITRAIMESVNLGTIKYYMYGRSKYALRLPQVKQTSYKVDATATQAIIEQEVGSPIYVHSASYGPMPIQDVIAPLLIQWGYDTLTTMCTTPPFKTRKYYSYTTKKYEYAPAKLVGYRWGSGKYLSVTFSQTYYSSVYQGYGNEYQNEQVTTTKTLQVPVAYGAEDRLYYVKYSLGIMTLEEAALINEADYLSWQYLKNSGGYPALDDAAVPMVGSTLLPIVPLRRNKSDLTNKAKYGTTELWKTSKALMRRLGVGFTDLGDSLNKSADIKHIDSAFFVYGIDIQTSNVHSLDYLYTFFYNLYQKQTYTKEHYEQWAGIKDNPVPPSVNSYEVADASYEMQLYYTYIDQWEEEAVIGKVGSIKSVSTIVKDGSHNIVSVRDTNNYSTVTSYNEVYRWSKSYFTITKQISETTVAIIKVFAPYHTNRITGSEIPDSIAYGTYKEDIMETSLGDSLNKANDKNNFIIPIDFVALMAHPAKARTSIIYDAMRIVVNTAYSKKLKWYQTGFFKVVMIIVAIYLTVQSLGTAGSLIGAAYAAGGIIAAAMVVAVMVVASMVMNYAVELVMKELGMEIGLIFAAILAVYSMGGGKTTLFSGSIMGAPFAVDTMTVLTALGSGMQAFAKDQMADMTNELEKLQAELDEAKAANAVKPADFDLMDAMMLGNGWITPDMVIDQSRMVAEVNLSVLDLNSYIDNFYSLDRPYI